MEPYCAVAVGGAHSLYGGKQQTTDRAWKELLEYQHQLPPLLHITQALILFLCVSPCTHTRRAHHCTSGYPGESVRANVWGEKVCARANSCTHMPICVCVAG